MEKSIDKSVVFDLQLSLPWGKVRVVNVTLLPFLFEKSLEKQFADGCVQDLIRIYPQLFTVWLPRVLPKTRPAEHRRGRPTRTFCEHALP